MYQNIPTLDDLCPGFSQLELGITLAKLMFTNIMKP